MCRLLFSKATVEEDLPHQVESKHLVLLALLVFDLVLRDTEFKLFTEL